MAVTVLVVPYSLDNGLDHVPETCHPKPWINNNGT